MKKIYDFFIWNESSISVNKNDTWKNFDRRLKNKEVFLFGAGDLCSDFLFNYYQKYNIKYIVDNDISKCNKEINGIEIISFKKLLEFNKDIDIIITCFDYRYDIKKQLNDNGYFNVHFLLDLEINDLFFYFKLNIYRFFSRYGIFKNSIVFYKNYLKRLFRLNSIKLQVDKISSIKNKHKGKRAFIIGTGPSLKIDDLNKLGNEITFSVNSIFKCFDKTNWRPTYYVVQDVNAIKKYREEYKDYNLKECSIDEVFVSESIKEQVIEKEEINKKIVLIPVNYLDHMVRQKSKKLKYTHDILYGHYCAHTVINLAINLVEYMGIKEIYLLGVDCDYAGKHYFDNSINITAQDINKANIMRDNQIRGYKFIKKKVEKRGVKIYNATRGGALEVFERVDFDSLFKEGI